MSKKNKISSEEKEGRRQEALKGYLEQVEKLQSEISDKDALCLEHGKATLKLALEAGTILNKAQNIVGHGEWSNWVTENIKGITLRTVQNYKALAYEEEDRQRCIAYDMKHDGKTKHVSLFEECSNVREAYWAVGISKIQKRGRVEDEKEQTPSPIHMKKKNPDQYKEDLSEATNQMSVVVQQILKVHPKATWDVTKWTINEEDGKIRFRDEETRNCIVSLMQEIALTKLGKRGGYRKITLHDAVSRKAEIVIVEVFKAIIRARPTTPSNGQRPEDFVFEVNKKPSPTTETNTAENTFVDYGENQTPLVETKEANTEEVPVG